MTSTACTAPGKNIMRCGAALKTCQREGINVGWGVRVLIFESGSG
jgi:hypothetical protein